jgi:hypothetical protein
MERKQKRRERNNQDRQGKAKGWSSVSWKWNSHLIPSDSFLNINYIEKIALARRVIYSKLLNNACLSI